MITMATPSSGNGFVAPHEASVTRRASNYTREDDAWSDDGHSDDSHRRPKRRKTEDGSRPMSVSCELCKTRKVKCDRGQPHCGWCIRNGQTCEYRERKKPGLRAGYGRELEARLDKLEDVLQAQNRVLQQLTSRIPDVQGSFSSLTSPASQSQSQSQSQRIEVNESPAFAQNISVDQVLSAPGTEVDQSTTYLNPGTNSSLNVGDAVDQLDDYSSVGAPVQTALGLQVESAQDHIGHYTDVSNVITQDRDFPPYDLLYALTDLFFKHINTWCPILHRRTTLDALFGPSTLEEADRILLHAIVATTLRFSTDVRLTEQTRREYYAASKQKVLLYGLENSTVKALQALVILALDTVGSSNGPPGWNLLALIARSVVQLGLAVETTSSTVTPLYPSIYTLRAMILPEASSFIEDESRRRLFWMVYLLDRYATIATAFDFALDDKHIDRKLPCRDDLFSRNEYVDTRWIKPTEQCDPIPDRAENLGSFSYYVEVIAILSDVHIFLKKPVDIGSLSDVELWQQEYRGLDARLNSWMFNLPIEYGNMNRLFMQTRGGSKAVNCIWIMLHVTYHTTVIRLNSSAAYPTTRSPIFTPSFAAARRCLGAVENICALCTYVRSNDMMNKLGPPFAFSIWVAARLLLVHGSTIDHHVNPAIGSLVDTLREMGTYWGVAQRYATLLQRVLDEYHESERAPVGADGVRETPSTVRILADMRRCAFDLDFLISHQPRQHFLGGQKTTNSATTPARTPAPNELEYLDVFDFFNMPRLPFQQPSSGSADADAAAVAIGGGGGGGHNTGNAPFSPAVDGGITTNEFNITNFMYDANADWLINGVAK